MDHVEPRKFLTKEMGTLAVNIPGILSSTKGNMFLDFPYGEHGKCGELKVIRASFTWRLTDERLVLEGS